MAHHLPKATPLFSFSSTTMGNSLADFKLLSVFTSRKNKTLGNMLSPSEFSVTKPKTWLFQTGFFPCHDSRCNACQYVSKKSDFTTVLDKRKCKILHFINCNTTFVVYCITCTICNLSYIGCTKRKLKVRIAEHTSDISHKRTAVSGAAKHFIEHHEASLSSFQFFGLEKVTRPSRGGNWVHKLFLREAFWIFHLNTRYPCGLNFRTDLSYLY